MPEPKYHPMFYNFVAKRLRQNYPNGDAHTSRERVAQQVAQRIVEDIALEFADRFLADNPEFDAVRFLDSCSPDTDLYPISELWEDYCERTGLVGTGS